LTVGKAKYAATSEGASGFMFAFKHRSTTYWRDTTEELLGPGRIFTFHTRPDVICHFATPTAVRLANSTAMHIHNAILYR